jgi:hypothetical protein
MNNVNFPR